ncbi:mitochondrial carrier [Flagelloscypha sp. PMI_526]|nr:mitochondrial carrier [Flagelloscypha sp. PMI_526]
MVNKTVKDLTAGTAGGICQASDSFALDALFTAWLTCCPLSTQVLVGQPFDIVKVRMQSAPAGTYSGMLQCATGIFRNEGPLAFYKGTLSPLIGIGACVSIQFAALEYTKGYFASRNRLAGVGGNDGNVLSAGQLLLSGGIAGVANGVVSCPVEHIRIRAFSQTRTRLYSGPGDAVLKIVKQHGLAGIFKGQNITFLREATGYSAYFLAYEKLVQSWMVDTGKTRDQLPATRAVIYGAAAGYALWAVIYPIDVVKTRIQTDGFSMADGRKYSGALDCVRKVWTQEGGWRAFARGLGPTLIRSPFANGATFLGFEMASRLLGPTVSTLE